MPEGGTLAVRAQPQEGGVIIQFTDNGVGIDEAIRENIFNPFFTTKDRGTGLGLAITHKIIEEHNGGIEVASIPGAGTTFTLTLPGIQE
jgi:signal transduction histidine kinase